MTAARRDDNAPAAIATQTSSPLAAQTASSIKTRHTHGKGQRHISNHPHIHTQTQTGHCSNHNAHSTKGHQHTYRHITHAAREQNPIRGSYRQAQWRQQVRVGSSEPKHVHASPPSMLGSRSQSSVTTKCQPNGLENSSDRLTDWSKIVVAKQRTWKIDQQTQPTKQPNWPDQQS